MVHTHLHIHNLPIRHNSVGHIDRLQLAKMLGRSTSLEMETMEQNHSPYNCSLQSSVATNLRFLFLNMGGWRVQIPSMASCSSTISNSLFAPCSTQPNTPAAVSSVLVRGETTITYGRAHSIQHSGLCMPWFNAKPGLQIGYHTCNNSDCNSSWCIRHRSLCMFGKPPHNFTPQLRLGCMLES